MTINPSKDSRNFELYSIPSFDRNAPEILNGTEIGSTKQAVEKGDILLCKINPRINRVWIVDQITDNPSIASSEWIVIRNKKLNPKYLMWYFRSPAFREYMLRDVSGVEKQKIERYLLHDGDVLFTEGGDYDKLGRGTVWQGELKLCLHQNHIFAVRPDRRQLNPFYLAYVAGSTYGKNYFMSCSKQTTNLASINSSQLKAFPIPLPTIDEQNEIVRILEYFFEKEEQAKELSSKLSEVEFIKKAILAQAFSGQLFTNDSDDANAINLLMEAVDESYSTSPKNQTEPVADAKIEKLQSSLNRILTHHVSQSDIQQLAEKFYETGEIDTRTIMSTLRLHSLTEAHNIEKLLARDNFHM